MYLKRLHIKNFRSIKELDLNLKKGLNVIVGENNSGKSAIIDALRICFGYGKQWRDIGIRNAEDFHIDTSIISDNLLPVEFHLYFKIETPEDGHTFNSLVAQDPGNSNQQDIQIHFRYYLEDSGKGSKTLRWSVWGGGIEGQPVKLEEMQLIYFSYLAALRNAELELRPYSRENKVISLFREMTKYVTRAADGSETEKELNEESKKALAKKLEVVISDEEWTGLIKSGESLVNEHLEKADIKKKSSKIHLKLLEYDYNNIIKGLLLRRSVYESTLLAGDETKQKYFDVSQNGLGENNLIYASAVLGDLKNRRGEEKEYFYSLLIEEPEAHLHPQKQNTFFNYLNQLQDWGVQIFITSHSPTLTAKSDLDCLTVLQRQGEIISAFRPSESDLTETNKQYLHKFLDVTKSQIFFSSGSILVEGISESLLLPVFAKMINEQYDLDKNGVEIVNVGGTSFDSFARLYTANAENRRLPSRCSLITDDDRSMAFIINFISEPAGVSKKVAEQIYRHLQDIELINADGRITYYDAATDLKLGPLAAHEVHTRQVLTNLIGKTSPRSENAKLLTGGNLKVFIAEFTFEYELLIQDRFNFRIVSIIYKTLHPKTKIPSTADIKNDALDFLVILNRNKDKSLLSERLAMFLGSRPKTRSKFKIPAYIESAIKWVIDAA